MLKIKTTKFIGKTNLLATALWLVVALVGVTSKPAQATLCPNMNCNSYCAPCGGMFTNTRIEEFTTTTTKCVNCDSRCPRHKYRVQVVRYYCDGILPNGDGESVPDANPCETKRPVGQSSGTC